MSRSKLAFVLALLFVVFDVLLKMTLAPAFVAFGSVLGSLAGLLIVVGVVLWALDRKKEG